MPLRVLQLTNMYPDASRPYFGIFVKHLVDGLADLDVESTVALVDGRGRWTNYVRGAVDLRRRLRRERYDLLHVHYGITGALAVQRKLPMILSLYGGDVHIPWQRQITRLGAWQADAVLYCSRRMERTLGIPGDIVSPGIDGDFFRPRDRDEARRRLGWRPEDRVVLFPSDPSRWDKDFPLFEATIARARTAGVRVATFGGVPHEDLPWMYSGADAMLLTSRMEGSPTVVKEGLSCGLPVVSVDVGDVEEQLGGLPHCHVVPRRDPEKLASALDDTLAALERVPRPKGLDHASVARRVRAIYDRVLG